MTDNTPSKIARRRMQPLPDVEREWVLRDAGYRPFMSYVEQYNMSRHSPIVREVLELRVKDGDIRIRRVRTILHVVGRRCYTRRTAPQWFLYRQGRVSGCKLMDMLFFFPGTDEILEEMLSLLHIRWACHMPGSELIQYAVSPSFFPAVIKGDIYSQETLVRAIAKRCYRMEHIDWRVWRDYLAIDRDNRAPINDLRDFTTDLTQSMKRFVAATYEQRRMYCDVIGMAADENQAVNLRWSERRLAEEHQEQIRRHLRYEIGSKENIPIYNSSAHRVLDTATITLLDNEMRVYEEGTIMHHCLYSCYWSMIAQRRYLAFHMTAPEDCTFGVDLWDGLPSLDQIYLKYDVPVQPDTLRLAEDYVTEHQALLQSLLSTHSPYHSDRWNYTDPDELF